MVRMEVSKIPNLRRVDKAERILIAQWKEKGLSNKRIAQLLSRSVSTIGREIRRNSFEGKFYEPLHAHQQCLVRRSKAWQAKHPLKNPKIYGYVLAQLREGWSPEQIAGRLKHDYPDDQSWQICHETIYRFIYQKENKKKAYWEYLRRKQLRRRKRPGRKSKRVRIPDRVSIQARPKEVERRKQVGHWEGDTLVGKRRLNGLHTAYERVTSIVKIEKMAALTASESIKAQIKIYQLLPANFRRSATLDNGLEHVKHKKLQSLGMKTYFTDPYSAWQRVGNENANLWLRYYFPKGTNFSQISTEELKDVEWELNNRPRKRLQFKTPMEVFQEYLP
jgi:IS30 family transposase